MSGPCPASPTGRPHAWLVCDNATLAGEHTWLCTTCDLMVHAPADASGCAPDNVPVHIEPPTYTRTFLEAWAEGGAA